MLPNVIKQYNNTIHDSTQVKPIDAIKDSNAPEVKTNLVLRSRFKRKYKEVHVDEYSEMKENVKIWTDKTYKVIEIDRSGINGRVSYKLDGLSNLYLRNELLLVEWSN